MSLDYAPEFDRQTRDDYGERQLMAGLQDTYERLISEEERPLSGRGHLAVSGVLAPQTPPRPESEEKAA